MSDLVRHEYDVRIDSGGNMWAANRLRIWLRQNYPSALVADGGKRLVPLTENASDHTDGFWADLPFAAASPLFEALSRHLGAVEHPEQLRGDFEHLRKRHDLLVDHLLTQSAGIPAAIELATRVVKAR